MNYQPTSRAAWRQWQEVSGDLDREILRVIAAADERGITCEKIEERIDRSHQSVSGNLRHLVERGFVEDSGCKGVTRSGRAAIAWRLASGDWLERRDAAMRQRAKHEKPMSVHGPLDLFGEGA
jgi:DNA-binding IclR family transcriptional regulator